jgi:asparagine synthase (glutamine-hydrolysing)
MSVPQRYAQLRRGLSDNDLKAALGVRLKSCFTAGFVEEYLCHLVDSGCEVLLQVSQVECRHYLLNTLLRDADAMSMGHGLEVRPVMLDHSLVEHALALPPAFKIRAGRHKAVLKDAVADLLPARLLSRPKTGFELPLGHWLRTVLRERLCTALGGVAARGLFAHAFLQDCRSRLDEPGAARLLWTMLVLITWMDEYKITLPSSSVPGLASAHS